MIEVILDSLYDSIKVFVFIFIIYIVLSFFELRITNTLKKGKKYNAFYGALMGLVPQCGISVIASDLYIKRHISMGTLVAIFLACSDEALVLLMGSSKAIMVLPLIIAKFVLGFMVGFLTDLIISKKEVENHIEECKECDVSDVKCCCNHCLNEEEENTKFDIHVWHPFIHSLKLIGVVFAFNILFGTLVYLLGETNIIHFLEFNKYLAPIFSTLIGLIPNCASSIILTELYVSNALSFGAFLSGLLVNAGLGLLMIFKRKDKLKENLIVISILVTTSIVTGYLTCLILGF